MKKSLFQNMGKQSLLSYIGGDFNIDLLQHKSKYIIDFEDVTMGRGFLPLISNIYSYT